MHQIQHSLRKWHCTIWHFSKSSGPVTITQQPLIPFSNSSNSSSKNNNDRNSNSNSNRKKIPATEKKTIPGETHPTTSKTNKIGGNNGKKPRKKYNKCSINADCNTKTSDKSGTTLYPLKTIIFEKIFKKIKFCMNVQIGIKAEWNTCNKKMYAWKLNLSQIVYFDRVLLVTIFRVVLSETNVFFKYFLIYLMEFVVLIDFLLKMFLENMSLVFLVLSVCLKSKVVYLTIFKLV